MRVMGRRRKCQAPMPCKSWMSIVSSSRALGPPAPAYPKFDSPVPQKGFSPLISLYKMSVPDICSNWGKLLFSPADPEEFTATCQFLFRLDFVCATDARSNFKEDKYEVISYHHLFPAHNRWRMFFTSPKRVQK